MLQNPGLWQRTKSFEHHRHLAEKTGQDFNQVVKSLLACCTISPRCSGKSCVSQDIPNIDLREETCKMGSSVVICWFFICFFLGASIDKGTATCFPFPSHGCVSPWSTVQRILDANAIRVRIQEWHLAFCWPLFDYLTLIWILTYIELLVPCRFLGSFPQDPSKYLGVQLQLSHAKALSSRKWVEHKTLHGLQRHRSMLQ